MKFKEMYHYLKQSNIALRLSVFICLTFSISSCVAPKNFVYFHNLKTDERHPGVITIDSLAKFEDPKIQVNDILAINVQIFNAQTLSQTNGLPESSSSNSSQSATAPNSFLVDKSGYIELQLIGFIKVAGLTTSEARELIKQKAKEYFKDPIVNLHIVNFNVTVQGDVGTPGVVNVTSEKASILDVLALAGDLSVSAKRKNILLARTENDKVTFARLDITNTDIYKSPYFYVKQRDYIYVEPNNYKQQSADNSFTRYASYFTAIAGLVSILLLTKVIK